MPVNRHAKAYLLSLIPPQNPNLFSSDRTPQEQIVSALESGNRTVRYGREWIVGGTEIRCALVSGRIGVQGEEGTADIWDPELKDFRETAIPSGLASPFAINTTTLVAIVQPRAPHIKLAGMVGALRALLQEEDKGWDIVAQKQQMTFQQWRETVSAVTKVRFLLRKPNPRWQGARDVEAVMEAAEAEYARFELAADSGLDIDSPFLAQSQHHVDRSYGEARYVGTKSHNGQESIYDTAIGAEEKAIELGAGDDGEISTDKLTAFVRQSTSK